MVVVGAMIGLRTSLYALMKDRTAAGESLDRNRPHIPDLSRILAFLKEGKFGR